MQGNQAREITDYVNNLLANNQQLAKRLPVSPENIYEQLHDGAILCCLANALAKNQEEVIPVKSIKFQRATLFHKMDNVNKALEGFKKQNLELINIRAEFIVEKKEASVIGLFNQLTRQRPAPKREKPAQKTGTYQEQKKTEPEQQQQQQQYKEQVQQYKEQQQQQYQEQQNQIQIQTEQQKPVPVYQEKLENIPQNPNVQINRSIYVPPEANHGYEFKQVFGPQILVLCGSLRKGSFNQSLVHTLHQIQSRPFFDSIHFHSPDLSSLPLFNEDLQRQSRIPKSVHDLREIAGKVNGILVSTPEYNGCLSPVIKNALDWLSRSYNEYSPLNKKKVGIVGASYLGPAGVNDAKDICEHSQANVLKSHFYISLRSKAFDQTSGKLTSLEEVDKLAIWYQDFSNFVLSGKDIPVPVPRWIA